MKLSIIIVNYNVRYFLEQCLHSVFRSQVNFPFEVFVVDNNSQDDSLAMLANKFPQVKVIANKENLGFSKANNQAIKQSDAQYYLLLNPDTVIPEDMLQKSVDFLDAHDNAGGLGVKMYDGSGKFLPESKRGFPSPMAAFAKMSGLAKLFPKSKLFGQYHLTYLDNNITAEVDVLSGACMFLRKSVLDLIGYLDEDYFMYGEDIDISYRIQQAWFKNYYFADTSIIHFKGESTKKGSLNYVRVFYNAMIIFSKKHIHGTQGKLLTGLLTIAIYFRALLAILQNLFGKIGIVLMDAALMFVNLYILQYVWQQYVRTDVVFPETFLLVNIPLYILSWLLAMWLCGVYAKSAKWKRLIAGLFIGTLIIATMYAFFPNSLRTSRGVIVFSFGMNIAALLLFRGFLALFLNSYRNFFISTKRYIVVSDAAEADYISGRLTATQPHYKYAGFVRVNGVEEKNNLGDIDQLEDIVEAYEPDEILFSTDKLSMQFIIQKMTAIRQPVEFKMVSQRNSAIGSSSKNRSGEIYTFDVEMPSKKSFLERLRNWI